MNKLSATACALLLAGVVVGWAQQEKQRSVVQLARGMAWQVEQLEDSERLFAPRERTSRAEEQAAKEVRLVEKNTVGRDHRRQELFDRDGRPTVRYITIDFLLIEQADGSFLLQDTVEHEESGVLPLRPDRLREFDWTKGLSPVASLEVDGVECDIYALQPNGLPAEPGYDLESGVQFLTAIGKNDRFPRRLETPGKVLRYVSRDRVKPGGLPEKAQLAVDEYMERLRLRIQRYALPR